MSMQYDDSQAYNQHNGYQQQQQQQQLMSHPKNEQLNFQIFMTFVAGVISLAAAIIGLYLWSRSEWLQFPGPYPRDWEGYTLFDFLALLAFTLLGPVGFVLIYIVLQYSMRVAAQKTSIMPLLGLTMLSILLLGAMSFFGFWWGWDILQCGVVGCVNSSFKTWHGADFKISEAGSGFQSTVGIPLLFTGVGFIIILIMAFINNLRSFHYNRQHLMMVNPTAIHQQYDEPLLTSSIVDEQPIPKNYNLKRYTPYNIHLLTQTKSYLSMPDSNDTTKRNKNHCKLWGWFLLYTLFLFIWWFSATYVPNNWEYYYPSRIAEKAALKVTNNGTLCDTKWREYTCPEYANSTFITHGVQLTETWQIKIYPSNLAFYSVLFFLPFFSLIAQTITSLNQFLQRKIRVPRPWNSKSYERTAFFTYYEIAALIIVLVGFSIFTHYWYWDHNFNGVWPGDYANFHISERISRTLGQLAVFVFGLLMFPAARNSPLLALLGISWESSMKYHRWLGVTFFIFTMGHMFTTYWWYYVKGTLKDIYQIPQKLPTSIDNFTVPIIQYCLWISIFTIGILTIAIPSFRRQRLGIFKYNTKTVE